MMMLRGNQSGRLAPRVGSLGTTSPAPVHIVRQYAARVKHLGALRMSDAALALERQSCCIALGAASRNH